MESLRTADGIELIRTLAQRILQERIEAEATARIGAERGEHTEARITAWRNRRWDKPLTTQAGHLELAIPRIHAGSFFPSPLEHQRRIDQPSCPAIR
ncbi:MULTISPECIES: transposase [unclassified Kitasatospora]|uniref:transposase n=1 Tax=unclassified Kitasatospora TaxID=2633591 RepID=UPI003824F954